MTDLEIIRVLGVVRDKLVVAITDVERGDHLRAAEAIEEAAAFLADAIDELKAAA